MSLEKELEVLCENLTQINEILSKVGGAQNYTKNLVYKGVEDGILDKIQNANAFQLNYIMNEYKFQYYTEFNSNRNLLRSEINKRLRDKKIDNLLK
jgi:hypothetical protein